MAPHLSSVLIDRRINTSQHNTIQREMCSRERKIKKGDMVAII